jgi:hypothetical protein
VVGKYISRLSKNTTFVRHLAAIRSPEAGVDADVTDPTEDQLRRVMELLDQLPPRVAVDLLVRSLQRWANQDRRRARAMADLIATLRPKSQNDDARRTSIGVIMLVIFALLGGGLGWLLRGIG